MKLPIVVKIYDPRVFATLIVADVTVFALMTAGLIDAIAQNEWWWALLFGVLAGWFGGFAISMAEGYRQQRKGGA